MEKKWWESTACWICDYWWVFLAFLLLILAAYFSRSFWLPVFGIIPNSGLVDVTVNTRSITLDLRDGGQVVDGDRIRLYVNNVVIVEDMTLSESPTFLNVDLVKGKNQIVIEALNEGTTAPNTVYIATSDVIEGLPVQFAEGLVTGEIAEFTIYAP